jgi:uncharacterized repeat protein (TIGR01451 family)
MTVDNAGSPRKARSLRSGVLGAVATVLAGLVLVAAPTPQPVSAAPGDDEIPARNPDLVAQCGLDILVILDESGSVEDFTGDVKTAFKAFTTALQNTGSRMAVAEFSTVARLPLSGAAKQSYTNVTTQTINTIFNPYINKNYKPSGRTHWEDAFRVGRFFLPPQSADIPHLTVFITDGNPNVVVNESKVTQSEYETKVPLDDDETISADEDDAADRAVPNANALKALNSHILTVAVGDGLDGDDTLRRLISVSGPNVFPDNTDFDISTTDVYREENFALLEAALREAAFQLCAPSVTVEKLLDQNPNPNTPDSQLVPGAGWELTTRVTPEPADWVLPPDGTGDTVVVETDAGGFANFQWTPAGQGPSGITVTEEDPAGVPPGYVNRPDRTRCVFRTPDQPDDKPLDVTAVDGGFSGSVPEESIVTCTMVNEVIARPAVTIEKDTNGVDANDPPGPFIPVDDRILWTYQVTNTGNVTLNDIVVTDDQGVTVTCPLASLASGRDMTCEATGLSEAGQYENLGTVTAVGSQGGPVSASDPSHYFGSAPGINVEKSTNGDDADIVGPVVPVGDPVAWEYIVTNVGNAPIGDVVLTDDQGVTPVFQGGDDNDNDLLDLTETWTYTAAGTAEAGRYENNATVTGTDTDLGTEVADSDPSHYFGEDLSVSIVKSTNLEDANDPPGPLITVGGPVVWQYVITNTGNVPISWTLTDDKAPFTFCPRPILVPGRSIACYSQGVAAPGQYENTGSVEGRSVISGNTATDDDPSHYYGVQGGIEIVKRTDGEDANQAPGPFIPPGDPVTWTYEVTNTGNIELTDVTVEDDKGVSVSCPMTELAVGESMTCDAEGAAEPDQYSNNATATGTTPTGVQVQDVDPSHYFGDVPGINLEKDTNGVDADEAPGPFIPVGDPVLWTYVVTNSGNSPLTDVAVTDDQGVTVSCPQDALAVGEVMRCTASGTSAIGQYENVGSVTATGPTGDVSDEDPSHYFGAVSEIDIEKFVNGQDADESPGVEIPVGDPVVMTFDVTNPGNVPIRTLDVIDDRGLDLTFLGGDANGNTMLDPGELWSYEAALGPATPGRFDNLGTVNGLDVLENTLTDDDPVFAFAAQPPEPPEPGLSIEKSPDQATVPEGGSHTFTITVTNTGEVDLVDVEVVDDVVPECDRTIGELPAGESTSYECTVEDVTEPIRNVATVTGETPDGETVRDRDDAVLDVEPADVGPGEAECPDPDNPNCPELPDTGGEPWWLLALGAVVAGSGVVIAVAWRRRSSI